MDQAIQHQFNLRAPNFERSASWISDPGLLACFVESYERSNNGAMMLDFCCGTGIVGGAFKGVVSKRIGLDLTDGMLEQARQKLDECHQGSAYNLPFSDATFDVATCRETVHLMKQPEQAIREVARVLKPGGQFILGHIVPYGETDRAWMEKIFRTKQPLAEGFYTEDSLRQLMETAGFHHISSRDYHLWESINLWVDTHETPPAARQAIYDTFRNADEAVRRVHPFEIGADGEIRDRWRWVILRGRRAPLVPEPGAMV